MSIAVTCKSAFVDPVVTSPIIISYPSACVIITPDLSDVSAAVIPVDPETEFIASLIDVKSVVVVIVAVMVEVVVLLPSKVKLKVAALLAVNFAFVNAVAATPVFPEIKLNDDATSLASAPASIDAVNVPKVPFTV